MDPELAAEFTYPFPHSAKPNSGVGCHPIWNRVSSSLGMPLPLSPIVRQTWDAWTSTVTSAVVLFACL